MPCGERWAACERERDGGGEAGVASGRLPSKDRRRDLVFVLTMPVALVGEVLFELGLLRSTFSDPEAGGVGGSARCGGGDGGGGVSPLHLPLFGVAGLDILAMLDRLRRFMAVRDIEAERGLGAYLVPSPRRMSRAGFVGDFTFGTGTSSATSIIGERQILTELGLSFDVVGEIGV